jgi:aspartyl aminopeptidase
MPDDMKSNPIIHELLNFLNESPTAWHATAVAVQMLKKQGFIELRENHAWDLKLGQAYFVTRNGSSLCAFVTPHSSPLRARLLATHTDSPSLKLKPQPEIRKQHMILLGVEVYGAPLLTSWLNRDLGLAGRAIYYNLKGQIETSLIRLEDAPLTIPQLAIHLDREVNEKGLILNRQEHLNALAAITELPKGCSYLETLLRQKIEYKQLLSTDLFLYPLEPARLIGYKQQMLAAYRLDNLASMHAALYAFLQDKNALEHDIKMIACWDNEEMGSNTAQGAASPFFSQTLERLLLSLGKGRADYLSLLSQSMCVSIDLSHALHPNYMEKHDPQHQILMGKGIATKHNAQCRYATDAHSILPICVAAKELNLPMQQFVSRNDIACGSTIGPIHASLTGMPTVDIGCAELSMHASRELMACQDHLSMCQLLQQLLQMPNLPQINETEH